MEVIKKRIKSNLGENIYFKIELTQKIENIGILTDITSEDDFEIDRCSGGLPLKFMNDGIISDYYKVGGIVNYGSDSKLEVVRTYDEDAKYIENFDTKKELYLSFSGTPINSVDRVVNINGDEIIYTVDAKKDINIGTDSQTTGIQYTDNPEGGVVIPPELNTRTVNTKVHYKAQGWNETNTSINPQIQEEYLLGIILEPEVETDVFIDRTNFSVLDKHLRLSEVESLEHLTKYGNKFYNINRD